MIRATLASGLLFSVLLSSPAWAIVVAYEGFDYPNESTLVQNRSGGFGWTNGWADNDMDYNGTLTADDTSLTSAAFPFSSVGDRISTTGGGEAMRLMGANFDMTQDGTVVFGGALVRKSVDGGTGGDAVEFRLVSNLSTQALRLGIGSDERLFFDSGAISDKGAGALELGDTYFLILKAVSSAAGDDQFFASAFAPGDSVPATEPVSWEIELNEAVDHIYNGVRMETGANVAGAEYDEFRIGNTWADVAVGTSFLLGDFNHSTDIDPGDLTALVEGLYVGSTYEQGDLDLNGVVDLHDYNAFRDIYLNAGLVFPAEAPVPEPATLVSLAAGLAALMFVRRGGRP